MTSEIGVGKPLSIRFRGGGSGFTGSELRSSARSRLSGRLGLVGLLATSAVICSSAARTALLLPGPLRPVASRLPGAFGLDGIDLGLAGLIAVLSLLFVSYVLVVRGADELSGRWVLCGVAGLLTLVLLAPPLLSTDVFSYIAYGRIGALYGANPYLSGPSAIALDPSYTFVGAHWVTTPSAYGPLFTALSYLLAPFAIAANVLAYKAIAAISSLVVVVMVWHAARLRGLNPVRSVALVGLNPVLVVYGVGGGHNDLLMLAILTTGVYVLLRRNERASGALIVAATAVKLTAGLLLPFALAQCASRRDGRRGVLALATGVAVAAAVAGAASWAMFGTGPFHLLDTLQDVQDSGALHSIPGALLTPIGLGHLSGVFDLISEVSVVLYVAWLVRRVSVGKLDWITGAGWATVALLISASGLLPWYIGWLAPLAALSRDRRLLITAITLTGVGLTTL